MVHCRLRPVRLSGRAALLLLDRTTWNRATFDVVIKQVYFTAVQILPVFLAYVLVISWLSSPSSCPPRAISV
jgi:hypothetical protein